MPGYLLHVGAVVVCPHSGLATPTVPNTRVTVSGMPTVIQLTPYTVANCQGGPTCTSAQWVRGASRVFSNGVPLLLSDSQAACAPSSAPLTVTLTQTRVSGT
jgi:hypothetical protein